jgi:HEAT repeat protein
MKSSRSPDPREGIRMKVLLPVALLVGLIVIAFIFTRSHLRSPAKPAGQETSIAIHSTTAPGLPRNTVTVHPSVRLSQPYVEPETERLISIMLDQSASSQLRRQAARSLGKIGTEEAMNALKSALASKDAPPYVKSAVAEGLGQSPSVESRDLLHELVSGKDQTTARAAARGLAARGDADAVDTLGKLLFNDQTPLGVRTEAALALGDVDLPSAQDQLTRALSQIHDEDVVESVLDGLGRRPFSETQEFFRNYLNSPDVPPVSKVLAIEAVRDSDGDVAPFLSHYLNDSNPTVRTAAKDALDFLGPNPAPSQGPTSSRK